MEPNVLRNNGDCNRTMYSVTAMSEVMTYWLITHDLLLGGFPTGVLHEGGMGTQVFKGEMFTLVYEFIVLDVLTNIIVCLHYCVILWNPSTRDVLSSVSEM